MGAPPVLAQAGGSDQAGGGRLLPAVSEIGSVAVPDKAMGSVDVSSDGRSSVRTNADGSKTMRIGVSRLGESEPGGSVRGVDARLSVQGGRVRPVSAVVPVSLGSSLTDPGGVVEVGRAGRRVRLGRPSATAFSPAPSAASGIGGSVGEAKRTTVASSGVLLGGSGAGLPGLTGAVTVPVDGVGERGVGGGGTPAGNAKKGVDADSVSRSRGPVGMVGCGGGSDNAAVGTLKQGCGSTVVVSGNRAVFAGVFGVGGDLAYDVGLDSVKERIVLKSPPETGRPVEYRFPLTVEGLAPVVANDGSVMFTDGAGPVFTIPVGWAWDSAGRHGGDVEIGLGSATSKVGFTVEGSGKTLTLVVRPDEAWLRDPFRVYPVSIDPTIEIGRGAFNGVSNRLVSPGAQAQLMNGDFESGTTTPSNWILYGAAAWQQNSNATVAQGGSGYLSVSASAAGGAVYQDVARSTPGGGSVTISAWVRSDSPSATGSLCGFLLWSTFESSCINFAVPGVWTRVEAVIDSSATPHDTLRVQLYPSVGTGTIQLDSVSVTWGNVGLRNGSFERGVSGWQSSSANSNWALYSNGAIAHDNTSYLASNTTDLGGGVYQDVATTAAPGQPISVSTWLRAQDIPATGTMCAWLLGQVTDPLSKCVNYSVTNSSWKRYSLLVQPANASSILRVQFYPTPSSGSTTLIDTVAASRTGDVNGPNVTFPSSNIGPAFQGEGIFGSWYGATQYTRLMFDNNPALVGATINSATLHTFVRNCDQKTVAGGQLAPYGVPLHVRRLTSDFDSSPTAVTDDRTVTVPGAVSYADVDITGYMRQWIADPASNYGVRLDLGDVNGGNYGYCKIASNSAEFGGDLNKTTYLEVTYNEPPLANKRYHPVPPVPVFGSWLPTGGMFTGPRNFTVAGGTTGVPTTGVSAVALNVSVFNTQNGTGGVAAIYPAGATFTGTSTLNWVGGQWAVSNHAVVAIGQGNQVAINIASGTADAAVEVVGYWDDGSAATTPGGLLYTPSSGFRAVDTRTGAPLAANVPRAVTVTGSGGVPATGVSAVAVSLVGISQAAEWGEIRTWASGDAMPNTTNVLVSGGDVRAGFATVKVGADGKINLRSTTSMHAIVDVVGWFSTNTTTGAGFQPLLPSRILDTRNTVGSVNDIDVTVSDGAGMSAAILNVTLAGTAGPGHVQVYPTGETPPGTSSMNYGTGAVTANMVIARLSGDGRVHIKLAGGAAPVIVDLLGYVATASNVAVPVDNKLVNGSFELADASTGAGSWRTGTICGDLAGQLTQTRVVTGVNTVNGADDGAALLRVQGTSVAASGSVCQDVNHTPATGQLYQLSFRARTTPGQAPGRGQVELWELGQASTSAWVRQPFITGPAWSDIEVEMCARTPANFTLRTKIYPYGTVPFDLDLARLTVVPSVKCVVNPGVPTASVIPGPATGASDLSDGSMNTGSDWKQCVDPTYRFLPTNPGGNVQIAVIPQTLGSYGNVLRTSRDQVGWGSNRACHDFGSVAPLNDDPLAPMAAHRFTVWVRSGDGTNFPARLALSAYIVETSNPPFPTWSLYTNSVGFTATSTWQQISVGWWPPTSSQIPRSTMLGTYTAEIITDTPGSQLLIDEATHTGVLSDNPGCTPSVCNGPPNPPPPPPVDREPNKLLTDSQRSYLHDVGRTRCLGMGSSGYLVVQTYGTNCVTFTPLAELANDGLPTYAGWSLWAGFDQCLTRTPSGLGFDNCNGTGSQQFYDILANAQQNGFMLRSRPTGECLDGSLGGPAYFAPCNYSSATQIWADDAKGPGPFPSVGTIPQEAKSIDHSEGDDDDDKWEMGQEALSGATFGGQVWQLFQNAPELYDFINPIHKLVQLDIARKLVAAGQPSKIECNHLGRVHPDVCSPEFPVAGYKHAEVKPSHNWVMAPTTAALAQVQLNVRDARLLQRHGIGGGAANRAVGGQFGWPTLGSITVGLFRIDWRYESPGLYIYKTNLTDLGLTAAAARVLRTALKWERDDSWGDFYNEKNTRFPPVVSSNDAVLRWARSVAMPVVAVVGFGAAIVVAAPAIAAGGAAVIGGAVVAGGAVVLGGVAS